jgi:hypothetical protein
MRPSSFVFVAIVGLWAAHLLPQWIRRRDALGASRGGDRHSSALRVLARRPRPRAGGPSSVPLLPSIAVVRAPVVHAPAPGPASPLAPEPTGRPAALCPADVAARRRRLVLAALVAFTLLSVIGAAAGAVPAFMAVVGVVLLGLDVAALRAAAVAGERRRAAEAERARRAAEIERARDARLARAAAARARAATAEVALEVDAPSSAAVQEQDLPGAPAAPPAPRGPLADDGTWVPVPVPPPTYTLKPVAPRPAPAPLEPALAPAPASAAGATPLRLVQEPEVDLDSVLERRRAVNL